MPRLPSMTPAISPVVGEERPRLLDLFCCEGGAGMGYHLAGLEVVGVDISPSSRYPFALLNADALSLRPEFLAQFDAIHASPPCQFVSELTPDKSRHANLIPETREFLRRSGLPYVIENVRKAAPHLIDPISLFGQMFDCHVIAASGQRFDLSRERLFETNWPLKMPPHGLGGHPIANVYGGHFRVRSGAYRTGGGTGRTVDLPGEDRQALAKAIMGMPWATMNGCSEAVPPAYTQYIGRELIAEIRSRQARAA
jgi:DNA (cytosine-5)-methyltransferase 1